MSGSIDLCSNAGRQGQNSRLVVEGGSLCTCQMSSKLNGMQVDGLASLSPRVQHLVEEWLRLDKVPTITWLNLIDGGS